MQLFVSKNATTIQRNKKIKKNHLYTQTHSFKRSPQQTIYENVKCDAVDFFFKLENFAWVFAVNESTPLNI